VEDNQNTVCEKTVAAEMRTMKTRVARIASLENMVVYA
jgi:hypothetical protein